MGLPMLWVMAAATSSLCATSQSMAAPILALRSAKPDANQAACACLAAFTACSMSLDLAYSRRVDRDRGADNALNFVKLCREGGVVADHYDVVACEWAVDK